jgi:hypothetical protein
MWARVTLSDRFYTPTLIRFDGAAALASAMA